MVVKYISSSIHLKSSSLFQICVVSFYLLFSFIFAYNIIVEIDHYLKSISLLFKLSPSPFLRSVSHHAVATAVLPRLSAFSRHFALSSVGMAPITKECDYLVIGGGSGDLASAGRASGQWVPKQSQWKAIVWGARALMLGSNHLHADN